MSIFLFAGSTANAFNVKDYGAVGDGSHDDTLAIRAAFTAMWSNGHNGGVVVFPPGNFKVTDAIDISNPNGGNFSSGRIEGSGKQVTFIGGTLNNGFVFYQLDGVNGPEEIAHLTLANSSTWIGSGALLFNNSSMVVHDCQFTGMINVLAPSNTFTACVNNCNGTPNSDVTTGANGTLGVAGNSINVKSWRSTGNFQVAIQLNGGNSCVLEGNGIENCGTAILLGPQTGWASSCTVVPDGSNPGKSILTVGGNLGSAAATRQFSVGSRIYGRGLPLQTWGADPNDNSGTTIVDNHNTDATLTGVGFAGTYRIDQSVTISTPIPIWSRTSDSISSCVINSHQSEACYHTLYVDNASALVTNGGGCGSQPDECVDAFGTTGFTPRVGVYLKSAGGSKLSGFASACAATYLGSIVVDPSATLTNVTFDSCTAQKKIDAITGSASIISNGSGGSGTILNVDSNTVAGSFIGIGMSVTGTGVTPGTIITGNHASNPSRTGGGGAGTYDVNNAHNLSARVFTITSGADWVMPTATASKAGLRFVNCGAANLPVGYVTGLNNLNMTFTCLPGQAGASSNMPVIEGMEYDIIDGAKSGGGSAIFADIVVGGGSQHIKVRYDGTNWRRCG